MAKTDLLHVVKVIWLLELHPLRYLHTKNAIPLKLGPPSINQYFALIFDMLWAIAVCIWRRT